MHLRRSESLRIVQLDRPSARHLSLGSGPLPVSESRPFSHVFRYLAEVSAEAPKRRKVASPCGLHSLPFQTSTLTHSPASTSQSTMSDDGGIAAGKACVATMQFPNYVPSVNCESLSFPSPDLPCATRSDIHRRRDADHSTDTAPFRFSYSYDVASVSLDAAEPDRARPLITPSPFSSLRWSHNLAHTHQWPESLRWYRVSSSSLCCAKDRVNRRALMNHHSAQGRPRSEQRAVEEPRTL